MKLHTPSKRGRARKMVMFLLFVLTLLFQLRVLAGVGVGDECTPASCGDYGPAIRFPFWLKGHQPQHCGYPNPYFTLSCSSTHQTLLHHSFPLKVWVVDIDYQYQYLFYTSIGCQPVSYLNLSASPTFYLPFHQTNYEYNYMLNFEYNHMHNFEYVYNSKYNMYNSEYYSEYNISLFSCPSSTNTDYYYNSITCLSSPGHNVYAAYSHLYMPLSLLSCTKLYDGPSIFSLYQLYFSQNSDGKVGILGWTKPNCSYCELGGNYCRLRNNSGEHETECLPNAEPPLLGPYPSDTYPWERKSGKNLKVKALVPAGLFILVVGLVAVYLVIRSNKLKKEDRVKIARFLEDYRALKPTRYTYTEIKKITDQFKDKLGQGGYGTVYKGKLSNDIQVAAKILNHFKENGEEFINEVGTIGTIHHVNVVRLVGYCADGYKRALVYEYLPSSLEKLISSDEKKRSLGWKKLHDIAMGIAKGIEYLHQGCDQRILHFDIKPHNVLLDQNFNPKISDFGLAKLCSKEQSVVSMTTARGTVGYIAPEVFSRNFGNVSHKSDVYSFGMLLLEMIGGRKMTNDTIQNSDEVYFPEWIYNYLNRGEGNVIGIQEDADAKIVRKLTVVGLWCIQWYPGGRPSMKVVVQMLEGDGSTLTMPPSPFSTTNASTSRGNMDGNSFSSKLEVISESE